MADVEELKIFYPGKILVADGGTLTQYVADSGTIDTLVDAALTEVDDFWNGGIVLFLGDTPTVALRGHTAHIKDFVASSDTITFAKALPAVVATGDKYIIIMGGNFRSTTELLGQRASGQFPELINLALTNITGVTLKYASPGLATPLVFTWVQSTSLLDIGGVTFNIVGDSTDTLIFDTTGNAWVVVDIVQASLPGTNQVDSLTLSRQTQTFVPDVEGFESKNSLKGKTRYRLQVIKNTAIDTMNSLVVGFPESSLNVVLDAAQSVGLGAGDFDLADATGLPTGGFFLYNETLDDARYITKRSGNTLTMAATNAWTKILVDANNTVEPFPGDAITSPSGSGIIDAIRLHSGTWAAGTANATFYVKNLTGSFLDTEQIQISAVNIAIVDGNDVKGIRDLTGQTWTSVSDTIYQMPATDIAIESPTADQFSDPASETIYPDQALAFSAPRDITASPLSIGALAAGDIYGVWFREWIMDDMKANAEEVDDLEYGWS